ncbi:MAG TPA: TIGR04255 family protein [Bacteroidia bacterium]|nr:TIGR04255 family protein [Bacteroidia bacterium]
MKIPKKINPDNLKDSIIQVLFNPGIAQELVLGSFNNFLSDTFDFVAASPKRKEVRVSDTEGLIIDQLERGYFLDKTKKVKVDVGANGIVFNSFKNYVGWEIYFPIMKNTISKLFEKGVIKEVHRVGIRYISQFDNVSLVENLEMSLALNIPNKNFEATQIRSEYVDQSFRVILTLINNINQNKEDSKPTANTSIVDIDVIQIGNINSANTVIEYIEKGHQKQKETFFSLLKPKFLETLHPEY